MDIYLLQQQSKLLYLVLLNVPIALVHLHRSYRGDHLRVANRYIIPYNLIMISTLAAAETQLNHTDLSKSTRELNTRCGQASTSITTQPLPALPSLF